MGFNLDKFETARFEPRTERVPVPALASFFSDGEDQSFLVRGLTSNELHIAFEAQKRNSNIGSIVEALASNKDAVQEIRKALGLASKETPGEVAKRLEMIVAGCVEPKFSLSQAVKLAQSFPIEFMMLTNRITELTGQGAIDMGKPVPASRKTKPST